MAGNRAATPSRSRRPSVFLCDLHARSANAAGSSTTRVNRITPSAPTRCHSPKRSYLISKSGNHVGLRPTRLGRHQNWHPSRGHYPLLKSRLHQLRWWRDALRPRARQRATTRESQKSTPVHYRQGIFSPYHPASSQTQAFFCLRRRAKNPITPNPAIIIAYVSGSGTAETLTKRAMAPDVLAEPTNAAPSLISSTL